MVQPRTRPTRSPVRSTTRVFISYRRSDTADPAQRIYEALVKHYGSINVFLDVKTVEPGADFARRADEAIASSDAVLLIIGPHTLPSAQDIKSRIGVPSSLHEYLFDEIRGALDRNIPIVPVLMQDAALPEWKDWPDLQLLAARNAVSVRDASWRADIRNLVEALDAALAADAVFTFGIPYQAYGKPKLRRQYERSPDMKITQLAHLLAQWARERGLLSQVIYRPEQVAVETRDRMQLRAKAGLELAVSICLREENGSLGVDICPAAWTTLAPVRRRPRGLGRGTAGAAALGGGMLYYMALDALGFVAAPGGMAVLLASFWLNHKFSVTERAVPYSAKAFLDRTLGEGEPIGEDELW